MAPLRVTLSDVAEETKTDVVDAENHHCEFITLTNLLLMLD